MPTHKTALGRRRRDTTHAVLMLLHESGWTATGAFVSLGTLALPQRVWNPTEGRRSLHT
jgi:hypothetical protein